MHKNSLFTLLQSFSSSELQRFSDFLHSPYFNKQKILAKAFVTLRVALRNKRRDEISYDLINKRLFSQLYPSHSYNEPRLRNIYSNLHKKAIEFIKQEEFSSAKLEGMRHLLRSLNNRHLSDEWEKASSPGLGKSGLDCNYFLNMSIIDSYRFNFSFLSKKVRHKKQIEKEIGHINSSVRSLLYYFLMEYTGTFLTYQNYLSYHNIHSMRSSLGNIRQDGLIEKVISSLDPQDEFYFIVQLYKYALLLNSEECDIKHYRYYKRILLRNIGKLSKDEINFSFSNLVSFLIANLSGRHDESLKTELFNIYKLMLDKEYYLSSSVSHLPHEVYRNILLHALTMKEYDWTRDFILKFSKKVHPNDIRNMECLGFAYLSYYESRYSEALNHLNEIELNYFQYKFDIKNLALRLYLELGYYEESLSLAKAYREMLKYDKTLSPDIKVRYRNFIDYYEKLVLLRISPKQDELDYLRHKLRSDKTVSFKSWLEEKSSYAHAKPQRKFKHKSKNIRLLWK